MLVADMFKSHGIVYGGTAKEREMAIKEIQNGFAAIGVPAMSVDAESMFTMLANILEKVADSKGPAFAVFCPDAKKIFSNNLIKEADLEKILKNCLSRKVLVYFVSSKLTDFPENIVDEFSVRVDLKKEGDSDDEITIAGKESKKEKDKKKMTGMEKTISRTASSAVTSVSRSVSTNIVNSVLGGNKKSINQIAKQAASTSLSTFLRNILKETLK